MFLFSLEMLNYICSELFLPIKINKISLMCSNSRKWIKLLFRTLIIKFKIITMIPNYSNMSILEIKIENINKILVTKEEKEEEEAKIVEDGNTIISILTTIITITSIKATCIHLLRKDRSPLHLITSIKCHLIRCISVKIISNNNKALW